MGTNGSFVVAVWVRKLAILEGLLADKNGYRGSLMHERRKEKAPG